MRQSCDKARLMMFEGKHIHFSPVDKKPLCSYSVKLCKQRRINGYAFCIRHILEDKSAPFKQCAHVARYNKQKCTNPIPSNENREFCNSHMQVAGILPKKERKNKKEKDKELFLPPDGKLKFADRLRALLKKESSISCNDDDDPFNSDDPYAFSDPISEQENGCIKFSATPILRTAWNCSQRISTEFSSDPLGKNELMTKNCSALDGKIKSNTPKLSKTMYRLHAKIAQNKILDKQKKTQDSSQSTLALTGTNFLPVSSIKVEPYSPTESISVSNDISDIEKNENLDLKQEISSDDGKSDKTSSLCSINLSDSASSCTDHSSKVDSCSSPVSVTHLDNSFVSSDSASEERTEFSIKFHTDSNLLSADKVPYVLQRIHRIFVEKQDDQILFPIGFESSESEKSDSEDESHLFSQISFSCNNRLSSRLRECKYSRHLKKIRLKSELQHSYQQLHRLHILRKQQAEHYQDLIYAIINSSRICPNQVTRILNEKLFLQNRKDHKMLQDELKCSFHKDGKVCRHNSLPFTCHCQKHIMHNGDQLLFQHCTAKYPDNAQCSVPVFDIYHELPLCMEHAQKKKNYQKMTLEPKPKKPRKKPKPSALTRPPKRGKKKKRPNLLRPTLPLAHLPSKPSNASLSRSSNHVSCHLSFGNSVLKSVETVLQAAEITRDLNGEIDSELGSDLEDQFSPGAIEKSLELPLDDTELANQATKLLEEHELTEVLNKIPEDAFNDFFVDARTGEYVPNEELERALAAVATKEVQLTNTPLPKLSSGTGTELEELERLLIADNLTSVIDENTFPELNNSLNVITSSFSSSDLHSFTQALSNSTADNVEQNHLPDSHTIPNSVATLLTSDGTHSNVLNGHTSAASLPPLHVDSNFTPNLLDNGISPRMQDGSAESRLLSSNNLAAILFGHSSSNVLPQTSFANGSSSISEDAGLISTQGGLTTTHWLLNSSEQVLALSHMTYQNGFIVTSQNGSGGSTYTSSPLFGSVGKYPLQTINAEVSLVSSNTPLVTSSCSENASSEITEQSNINHVNQQITLKQNGSSKVMVQEGAS